MPNFELSISVNYVLDWTLLHAIREIFQNSLDRQTENPVENTMLFDYDEGLQLLKIGNRNSNLCPSSLVLGNSSKTQDDRMIGQFGEGYKLALVVLLRLGKSVTIYNNPDVWTPTIKMSDNFKTPVLNINVVKYRFKTLPEENLIFKISGITKDEYETIRKTNLFFHPPTPAITCNEGRILLDPEYKGMIFVKGLHIVTIDRAAYGYDFNPEHIEIGRDRNLVNEFSIFYKTSAMWAGSAGHEEVILGMIRDASPDTEHIDSFVWRIPKETVQYVGNSWYCKNPDCVPCSNEAQAKKVRDLYGKDTKTVIVSSQLYSILQQTIQFREFRGQQVTAVPPSDLMKKVFSHLDRFKPSQQKEIKALLEMSKQWVWVAK